MDKCHQMNTHEWVLLNGWEKKCKHDMKMSAIAAFFVDIF